MTERDLLNILQRYTYLQDQLRKAEGVLEAMQYGITPSYDNTGGGRCSGNKSKVEEFAIRKMKLQREADEHRKKLRIADAALDCPELTTIEMCTLNWIAMNGKLAEFAEMKGIYKSNVYKIRDKALKKALDYIMRYVTG